MHCTAKPTDVSPLHVPIPIHYTLCTVHMYVHLFLHFVTEQLHTLTLACYDPPTFPDVDYTLRFLTNHI